MLLCCPTSHLTLSDRSHSRQRRGSHHRALTSPSRRAARRGPDACIVPHRGGASLSHARASAFEEPARPSAATSVLSSQRLPPHVRSRLPNCWRFVSKL